MKDISSDEFGRDVDHSLVRGLNWETESCHIVDARGKDFDNDLAFQAYKVFREKHVRFDTSGLIFITSIGMKRYFDIFLSDYIQDASIIYNVLSRIPIRYSPYIAENQHLRIKKYVPTKIVGSKKSPFYLDSYFPYYLYININGNGWREISFYPNASDNNSIHVSDVSKIIDKELYKHGDPARSYQDEESRLIIQCKMPGAKKSIEFKKSPGDRLDFGRVLGFTGNVNTSSVYGCDSFEMEESEEGTYMLLTYGNNILSNGELIDICDFDKVVKIKNIRNRYGNKKKTIVER